MHNYVNFRFVGMGRLQFWILLEAVPGQADSLPGPKNDHMASEQVHRRTTASSTQAIRRIRGIAT